MMSKDTSGRCSLSGDTICTTSSEVDYICTCHPVCPLDCVPKKQKGKQHLGRGDSYFLGEAEQVSLQAESGAFQSYLGELEGESGKRICRHDITTSGNILDRIIDDPNRNREPFLCPWITNTRFADILPSDTLNNHQFVASTKKTVLDSGCSLRVTSEPRKYRQPAIVATVGPMCTAAEDIEELIAAGVNMVRINMVEGDRCSHQEIFRNVQEASAKHSAKIGFYISTGTIVDLKGSEVRTGWIHPKCLKEGNRGIQLKKDHEIKLTNDIAYQMKCTCNTVYIDNPAMLPLLRRGMQVFIDGDRIKLCVESPSERHCTCRVVEGGLLGSHKPVHVPMLPIPLQNITDKDVEDILMVVEQDVDCIAVPNVRNANIVKEIRQIVVEKVELRKKTGEKSILILANISSYEGLENIDEIVDEADGVVIQGADLGVELHPEKVFVAQREIISKCNKAGKPVLCSTQLLPSMLHQERPSIPEVNAIAFCIVDGADGIVLTLETAEGEYPIETVKVAHNLLREAEAATMQRPFFSEMLEGLVPAVEPKVVLALAAVQMAHLVRASAIIVMTVSGVSAQLLSWFRPRCSVLAVCRSGRIARQLNLYRAVMPLHYQGPVVPDWFQDVDFRFQYGITYGKETGIIRAGDPLVLLCGYTKGAGFCNCLRVVYASLKPGVYIEEPPAEYLKYTSW